MNLQDLRCPLVTLLVTPVGYKPKNPYDFKCLCGGRQSLTPYHFDLEPMVGSPVLLMQHLITFP